MTTCCVTDCTRTDIAAKSRCAKHYQALRRIELGLPIRETDQLHRFWTKVNKTDYCWLWTAAISNGYGRIWWNGKLQLAHRVAYELEVGPIPNELEIDHVCHTSAVELGICRGGDCIHRRCVNPQHLEPVIQVTNLLRGLSPMAQHARSEYCVNNHPWSPETTYLWHGIRHCTICRDSITAARDRTPPPRRTLPAVCVVCSTSFTYLSKQGKPPNACSTECKWIRKQQTNRAAYLRR